MVVGRAEEISSYSRSRFCTVNCRPTASNYRELNPDFRGGRRECYYSATIAPNTLLKPYGDDPGWVCFCKEIGFNFCKNE